MKIDPNRELLNGDGNVVQDNYNDKLSQLIRVMAVYAREVLNKQFETDDEVIKYFLGFCSAEDMEDINKSRPLTIGLALSGSLFTYKGENKNLTVTEVSDCYSLAMRLRQDDEVVLTNEEVALAKKAVVQQFQPLISGQIIHILDGNL